jgi:hypothetical protein
LVIIQDIAIGLSEITDAKALAIIAHVSDEYIFRHDYIKNITNAPNLYHE